MNALAPSARKPRRTHGEIAHDIAMTRLSLLCAREMAERAERRLGALADELADAANGPPMTTARTSEPGA